MLDIQSRNKTEKVRKWNKGDTGDRNRGKELVKNFHLILWHSPLREGKWLSSRIHSTLGRSNIGCPLNPSPLSTGQNEFFPRRILQLKEASWEGTSSLNSFTFEDRLGLKETVIVSKVFLLIIRLSLDSLNISGHKFGRSGKGSNQFTLQFLRDTEGPETVLVLCGTSPQQ